MGKRKKRKPGPEAERLKIKGNWKDAAKKLVRPQDEADEPEEDEQDEEAADD